MKVTNSYGKKIKVKLQIAITKEQLISASV